MACSVARALVLAVGLTAVFGLTVGCATSDPAAGSGRTRRTTATLADLDPVPIAAHPTPSLPVTVHGFDGATADVSRIVAVDLYGTLAQAVCTLGPGDQLVGRSASAAFPAVRGRRAA